MFMSTRGEATCQRPRQQATSNKATFIRFNDAVNTGEVISKMIDEVVEPDVLFHAPVPTGATGVIHGAGGAVGSTAVQLARWAGAQVIGTGRSRARPLAAELGADRFIALDADRLQDAAGQADLAFDTIGGEVLARPPSSGPEERWSRSRPPRSHPQAGTTSGRSS